MTIFLLYLITSFNIFLTEANILHNEILKNINQAPVNVTVDNEINIKQQIHIGSNETLTDVETTTQILTEIKLKEDKLQNENNKNIKQIQPDQIKEDDKNGSNHENWSNDEHGSNDENGSNDEIGSNDENWSNDENGSNNEIGSNHSNGANDKIEYADDHKVTSIYNHIENSLETNADVKNKEKTATTVEIIESSTTPESIFSPSPYLGSVIEEVIEEPIAQQRDINIQTNFIPMRTRENLINQLIGDSQFTRQYPSFHSISTIIPVYGDSYLLHSNQDINEDFQNENFNENPYGRIQFPEEQSKYYPIHLNEIQIVKDNPNLDKPLKFDKDENFKQYDFPYKLENADGTDVDNHLDNSLPFISNIGIINNGSIVKNTDRTIHGNSIMKNSNNSLPLEMKKNYPRKYPHSMWKKAAHTLMAFLPIGLMLAAIPPKVIKLNNTHTPGRYDVVTSTPSPNSINPYFFKENINSRRSQRRERSVIKRKLFE